MKFIFLFFTTLTVVTAQQYHHQYVPGFDLQFQPSQAQAQTSKNSQPMAVASWPQYQQQRARELSGFPQNYPQSVVPVIGHDGQPQQPNSGCRTPISGGQQRQQKQLSDQPNEIPSQDTYPSKPLYQPPVMSYSANQQVGQFVQPPQSMYEILLPPHRNDLGDDSQFRQQQQPSSGPSHMNQSPHRYPLTPPSLRFKIGLVADLDKDSASDNGTFMSYLKEGHLIIHKLTEKQKKDSQGENGTSSQNHNVTVEFKDDAGIQTLTSGLNNAGRGLELSTLNVFDGKLYSCDDQTGIIYELEVDPETDNMTTTPWVILPDILKKSTFKCEWATVKDNHLWIGSLGTFVDKDGNEEFDKRCVRKVNSNGQITVIDWTDNYEKLSKAIDIDLTNGFVNHEAVAWSDDLSKWIFTPRRVSQEKFNKTTIEETGSNLAIFADDEFNEIETKELGELVATSGFTSVKFIPGYNMILTLKAGTDKDSGKVGSTLSVYDLEGKEIMKPTFVDEGVYSGVEFL